MGVCTLCKEPGHWKRECPHLRPLLDRGEVHLRGNLIVVGPPGHHFAQDANFYKPGTSIKKLKAQVASWQKMYGTQREQHQPGSQP